MIAVLFLLAVIMALATLAVTSRLALRETSARLDQARLRDDARTTLFQSMVTPLAWVQFYGPDDRLVRHSMVSCFEAVRKGLDLDSVGMAERLEAVPEAPRRLPRYPQVPPYLATPADLAQVPDTLSGRPDLLQVLDHATEKAALDARQAQVGIDHGAAPTSMVVTDAEGTPRVLTFETEADGVTPRKIGDDFCPCLPPYPQTWTNLAGTVVCRRCNHPVHQSRYEATQ